MVIKQGIYDWINHDKVPTNQLKADVATCKLLLKHIRPLSNNWKDLKEEDLKTTAPAVKHFLEIVRAQFRSPNLEREVEEARQIKEELDRYQPDESSGTESEQSFGKKQPGKQVSK